MVSRPNLGSRNQTVARLPRKSFPYLPAGREIQFVSQNNLFFEEAAKLRRVLAAAYPSAVVTASVVVKEGLVIGKGINKPIHNSFCPRTAFSCASGQGYELCKKYCHSDNHSEAQAIKDAGESGTTNGADLYLLGHWWICKPCWDKIIAAGISDVYLVEGAKDKFFQAVSSKGEPMKSLDIFIRGYAVTSDLKGKLAKVKISVVEAPSKADFVFDAHEELSTEQFIVRLSEALEQAGLYRDAGSSS